MFNNSIITPTTIKNAPNPGLNISPGVGSWLSNFDMTSSDTGSNHFRNTN